MYSLGQSVGSSFACADGAGGPGISSCTASDGSSSGAPVNTATGGAHTFTVTAVSRDGLSSTTSVGYRVLLPPRVLLPLPANGSVFLLGQAVRSWYLCADGAGGPGLKSCVDQDGRPMGAALDTSTLGLHQFAVTATSQDGLSTTQTVTYDVVAAPRAANVRVHRHGRITLDLLMPGPGTADVYATASYRSFAVAAAAPFAAGDIAAGDLVRAPRGTTIVAREDLRAAQAATFHVSLPLTATGRLLFQFHRSAVVELSVLYLPRLGLAQTFRLAAIRDRR
jgi:hypothetical protein